MEGHSRDGVIALQAQAGEQFGSSRLTREAIADRTLLEFGSERLIALCRAIDPRAAPDALVGVFRRLASAWGERRVGKQPRYPSNVSDDEAPFEFSVALSGDAPEVQVYVEAQGEPPGPLSNMVAGRAALGAVASEVGASLDRLHEIESLFFPDAPEPPFSLWVGASWAPGSEILLKAYLNPQVRGPASAPRLVAECMDRLGFTRAWSGVVKALSMHDGKDEATIVCLDLSNARHSRIKIYVRRHGATVRDIQAVAKLANGCHEDDVATFYSILGGDTGRFSGKAPITELAFVDPSASEPSEVSLTFPIRSYVANDAEARQRILRCLTAFGLDSEEYERALRAIATRPLDERVGIHSHVTLRRPPANSLSVRRRADNVASTPPASLPANAQRGGARVAVYFASEAYVREPVQVVEAARRHPRRG